MDVGLKKALKHYARTIKYKSLRAGEPLLERYKKEFPEFEQLAFAIALMLRTEEILREDIPDLL